MPLKRLASRLDTLNAPRRMREARAGWAARSRADIRFLDAGGVQFRYRVRGEGPPIVFTADPPVTLELYDEVLDVFARRFRTIVFEPPAMGFSVPRSGFDFSFAKVNDAIIAFLERAAERPAILAFSCVTGLGAVDIAVRRPDLVSHLVLIQTPSWEEELRWKKSRDPKGVLGAPVLGQWAMHRLKKSRAPAWLDLAVGRREALPRFCRCALESLDHGAGWALASAFQCYLPDAPSPLAQPQQPFLAVWGVADGSHARTDRRSSLALGASGALVEHADLGHFPELEDAARVYGDVCRFVDAAAAVKLEA